MFNYYVGVGIFSGFVEGCLVSFLGVFGYGFCVWFRVGSRFIFGRIIFRKGCGRGRNVKFFIFYFFKEL